MIRSLRNHGLTLIELMIAMLISFIGAVAVFAMFIGQSRAMRQSQDSMEIQDNVRVALDMIGRDIRSAGFMLAARGHAVRVENNCGGGGAGGPSYPGVAQASGTLTVGGSSAITVNGDVVGTTQRDGCPNGSDRLSVFLRPRTDFVGHAPTNAGANALFDWECPGNDCTSPFTRAGITGTTCGSAAMSDPVKVCSIADPYMCMDVKVQPQGTCGTGCNNAICTVQVNDLSGNPVTGADWDPVCPGGCASVPEAKVGAGFNAVESRTYQLMDVDLDGATELVVSDDQNDYLMASTPAAATFDVVANYIDDLQISTRFRNDPSATFNDVSLWNMLNCTPNADNACVHPLMAPASFNPPAELRVSIVARSAKRRISETGTVDPSRRTSLHDNNPVFTPYNLGAIPTGPAYCYGTEACGCGASPTPSTYLTCTEQGNAQGYARRVVTEVISLRNLATFQ